MVQMSFDKEFEHSDKLFEAALEEFIIHGYEQASINTILIKAGMSKGQFYYHFKNKEGLYLALIDVMIEKKKAFLTSVMNPEDFTQDIFSVFQAQIRYGLAFAQEYPAINQFADSFLREKGNQIYKRALQVYDFEENQSISALIEQAFAKGEFREDLPLPFIKKTIGYLFTSIPDMLELENTADFEDQMEYLVSFMRIGLARTT
jgi:AcrR family transcriptional regulator